MSQRQTHYPHMESPEPHGHENMGASVQTQLLQHLIDSAAMRVDIETLKKADTDKTAHLLQAIATLNTEFRNLRDAITEIPRQIHDCRADMRREIERDFPNKTEALSMEQRIEQKVAETDKTLGKQIAEVDKKLSSEIGTVKTEVNNVKSTVEKQSMRISVTVGTIIAIAAIIQWIVAIYMGVFK